MKASKLTIDGERQPYALRVKNDEFRNEIDPHIFAIFDNLEKLKKIALEKMPDLTRADMQGFLMCMQRIGYTAENVGMSPFREKERQGQEKEQGDIK